MSACYFIGLDIHKKMIAYCIKTIDGRLAGRSRDGFRRQGIFEYMGAEPARSMDRSDGGHHLHWLGL